MNAMNQWIEKQWEGAELGDQRLVTRAIKIGQSCLAKPDGSLPKKFGQWTQTKAAYRFFNSQKVSHESLQAVHNKNVYEHAARSQGMVLFVQDGSELIYNSHRSTYGLGPTADAFGQGIMFHTALAIEWQKDRSPLVLGVAKQMAWIRPEPSEEKSKKEQEEKESRVWLDTLKAIGRPPANSNWVSVGDRGNDIYSYVSGATLEGWQYVLRAKHDRTILVDGKQKRLKVWLRSLDAKIGYTLDLRSRGQKLSRIAKLRVSYGQALMLAPKGGSGEPIPVTYVRAWDPEDESLEWMLVTSLPVRSPEEALIIIGIYEHRWIIEEYHKCLKTGCRIEEAQLTTGKRLLALLGILGVIATQLLQLRDLSRQAADEDAEEVVSSDLVAVVKNFYKLQGPISIGDLWRRIAMIGGFLGRKSDGEPGWQTIWSGWLRVQDRLAGMGLARAMDSPPKA